MEDIPSLPLVEPKDLIKTEESLYWEKDDVNPNQVIYDLDNNKTIIPQSEDEVEVTPTQRGPKFIIRNVSNTQYRNNR
jgi:hypothetical protein